MRNFIAKILLSLLCSLSISVWAGEKVAVGRYPFLPFVGKSGGLTFELIQAMNTFQSDYEFYLVETSPNRRYRDMENGLFSVMFFENIKWGWDTSKVDASKVFLSGDGEIYVALHAPGRGQDYFKNIDDKHILAVTGYHYGFANFETDPAVLGRQYHITFSPDNEVSLHNLLAGRGDVAVITKSYLKSYLVNDPQAASALLVSDRFDQIYAHSAVVKKGSKPSAQEIDQLFAKMRSAGILKKLWVRYGLDSQP